jgi:glucose/arabinose dehydrogenase
MSYKSLPVLLIALMTTLLGACGTPQPQSIPAQTATLPAITPSATPSTAAIPTTTPEANPSSEPTITQPAPELAALKVELRLVTEGLAMPTGLANANDGSGRLFIIEKRGTIRVLRDGILLDPPFLDITRRVGSSASEQGLLGLAFHPNYASNGFFFVNYTNRQGDTVISRFSVSSTDPNRAEPDSEVIVLVIDQPAPNHNGGNLLFGPDGYLYVGMGDGGGAGDIFGNGQNRQSLLGKMLRINVDELPYAIPPDNPFVAVSSTRPEIWALGLRNPWRFSFDRLTGDLYIADVGQNTYEEVNFQPAGSRGGENYGWPIMEGLHCYDRGSCSVEGLTLPVAEYDHSAGCSVTGGYVYRGRRFPALNGVYLFSDYCTGTLWGTTQAPDGSWETAVLGQTGINPSSFGEDEAGELYILDLAGGALYQIIVP